MFLRALVLVLLPTLGCACAPSTAARDDAPPPRIQFTQTGDDVVPRMFHRASVLPNGHVIVTGGSSVRFTPKPELVTLGDVSFFDPATGVFSRAGQMKLLTPRSEHTQTTLKNGRVLVAGGRTGASGADPGRLVASAEVIDPATGVVINTPPMNEARTGHTATLLPDGRVLIVGGKSWQVFDPASNGWSQPVDLVKARSHHAAVLLTDERGSVGLLVIGGKGGGPTLELIDVGGGKSRVLDAELETAVDDLAATLLPDGDVLIVGGQRLADGNTISHVHLYEPEAEQLSRLDDLPLKRGVADHLLIVVENLAIALGGEQQYMGKDLELDTCLVFDIRSRTWAKSSMLHPHDDACVVELADGRYLLIGGGVPLLGYAAPSANAELIEFMRQSEKNDQ